MMNTALYLTGPIAIRYPRGTGSCNELTKDSKTLPLGKANVIRRGHSGFALLNFGPLLNNLAAIADEMDLTLVDMRFVKPLDQALLTSLSSDHSHFFTLEDHAIAAGAGSAVSQYLADKKLSYTYMGIEDEYIAHGSREQQLAICGLDEQGISATIKRVMGG